MKQHRRSETMDSIGVQRKKKKYNMGVMYILGFSKNIRINLSFHNIVGRAGRKT